MLRRTLLALAVMSTVLVPTGSRAATTYPIDVMNSSFAPKAVVAATGDTIRWNVRSGSGHTVTAYSGATFDSGPFNLEANDTFETSYAGGTVLYRCKNHSMLSGPANDCAGMCGKLTDTAPSDMPTVPTVSSPAHGWTTDNRVVRFTGAVTRNAALVRMFEGALELGNGVAVSGGAWESTWTFPNGTHHVRFVAEHPEGFYTLSGPARTVPNPDTDPEAPPTIIERFITVTVASADSSPPVILLDQPRERYSRSPLIVTGRVLDDVAVGTIEVTLRDNLLMSNKPSRPVTCEGCGTNSASFYVPYVLDPGYYTITVKATDLTNKTHVVTRDVVVLI